MQRLATLTQAALLLPLLMGVAEGQETWGGLRCGMPQDAIGLALGSEAVSGGGATFGDSPEREDGWRVPTLGGGAGTLQVPHEEVAWSVPTTVAACKAVAGASVGPTNQVLSSVRLRIRPSECDVVPGARVYDRIVSLLKEQFGKPKKKNGVSTWRHQGQTIKVETLRSRPGVLANPNKAALIDITYSCGSSQRGEFGETTAD